MSSEKRTEHLFVYGTLRDEVNHAMSKVLQKHTHKTCRATFKGKLFDAGSFPAAIRSDDESDNVHGKLYAIQESESVFRQLDPYEGYNPHHPSKSLFIREKVTVQVDRTSTIDSWIYLYNKSTDKLAPIPNGDYLSHLKNKE